MPWGRAVMVVFKVGIILNTRVKASTDSSRRVWSSKTQAPADRQWKSGRTCEGQINEKTRDGCRNMVLSCFSRREYVKTVESLLARFQVNSNLIIIKVGTCHCNNHILKIIMRKQTIKQISHAYRFTFYA